VGQITRQKYEIDANSWKKQTLHLFNDQMKDTLWIGFQGPQLLLVALKDRLTKGYATYQPLFSPFDMELPEHSASFSDLAEHSASFSDLLDPYYNPKHQRSAPGSPSKPSPIAQTQIGLYHHSPSTVPIAQTQIGQNQRNFNPRFTSQLRAKPSPRARNVSNPPYIKPILKKNISHADIGHTSQSDNTAAKTTPPTRRRVSLVMPSAEPNQSHCKAAAAHNDANDTTDSESEADIIPELISKPDGEDGRPSRGGYTLKNILDWDREQYRKIRVFGTYSIHSAYHTHRLYLSYSIGACQSPG
jgi:hypothetical protein